MIYNSGNSNGGGKKIDKPLLRTETVIINNIPEETQESVTKLGTVTAPEVDGYTFVSWIGSTSIGWVCATYIEYGLRKTSDVWKGSAALSISRSGNAKVYCNALYILNDYA